MPSEMISRLIGLAWQYGPFFFSIWFLIVISRWCYRNYDRACVRPNPPATQEELRSLKWIFITSFAVGTILVLASVVWWFGYKPKEYVYKGVIRKLQGYEWVTSDKLYFRTEPLPALPGDPSPLRNEHFAVIESRPFEKGEMFEFDFAKNQEKRSTFHIDFDPADPEPTFHIDFDESQGKHILKRMPHVSPSTKFMPLEPTIYAGTPLFVQQAEQEAGRVKTRSQLPKPQKTETAWIIDVLQDRLSNVGSKINALEKLGALQPTVLRELMGVSTPVEPMLLTVLDLTRHSDREISYKAKRILTSLDFEDYLADKLDSDADWRFAEKILLRIEQREGREIIRRAEAKGKRVPKALLKEIASSAKTNVLVPTWAPDGDRYYVKATWDPTDKKVESCLRDLFHSELAGGPTRSLEQEAEIMKRKHGERYVYWDKDFALYIAGKIRNCGGTATFLNPTWQRSTSTARE